MPQDYDGIFTFIKRVSEEGAKEDVKSEVFDFSLLERLSKEATVKEFCELRCAEKKSKHLFDERPPEKHP